MTKMNDLSRRHCLRNLMVALTTGTVLSVTDGFASPQKIKSAKTESASIRFGLVTYMIGAKWNLPTLIKNCAAANVQGVELRTTHKHGVEISLSKQARKETAGRFADSAIDWVGIGSNCRFDSPDKKTLKKNIEETKAFIKLSHDIGSTGVKVKPNSFQKNIPPEKTIFQIGESLNELGKFAADYKQQIRLEVHGACAKLPTIKKIMDIATQKQVTVCWNSNPTDLTGQGLEHNFNLVKDRFGEVFHVRQLESKKYPYQKLFNLIKKMKYEGWVLLEQGPPRDGNNVKELIRQRKLFEQLIAQK